MAYRNKTYLCFDGDEDIRYYNLMRAWKQDDNSDFPFYDAHDLKPLLASRSEDTVKRTLRERMANSKMFVVLVGAKTKNLYKFVRWEIDLAVSKDLPIVCVNLSGLREVDDELCPPILRDELAIHISYNRAIIEYAFGHWGSRHVELRKEGAAGPRFYKKHVYEGLAL